jgi:exonuclease SbcC
LEVATAAIEALPTGGRMVGIITHIQELTNRLPAKLLVERRTDGSRVTWLT